MKVICINDIDPTFYDYCSLTIGKEYECLNIIAPTDVYVFEKYEIKNDAEFITRYPSIMFITMDKIRDKKLRELGI